jgi:hypothetical protein
MLKDCFSNPRRLATIWHGQITAEAFRQLEAAVKDKGGSPAPIPGCTTRSGGITIDSGRSRRLPQTRGDIFDVHFAERAFHQRRPAVLPSCIQDV